jgi:hypothetical protein
MEMTDYALRTHMRLPYEAAIEAVTAALKNEGFGVLTEIDVQATMKRRLQSPARLPGPQQRTGNWPAAALQRHRLRRR